MGKVGSLPLSLNGKVGEEGCQRDAIVLILSLRRESSARVSP